VRLLLPCLLLVLCACAPVASRAPASRAPRADAVDYGCRTDADCAVKDVGTCCGRYPACVNRDSPTFPERVRADCARKGMAGVCGFPDVTGCTCVDGRCSNVVAGAAATR
jgi:hypothetical protein